ncbi:MAG TPA: phenylalanine--tRNA ligase subunit beta [Blastocatellia bacterium]|nr:phenylalanine--tRNA ligase subunit beta [Blastocatellia bacterium]
MKISYKWLGELVDLTLAPRELADRLAMVGFVVDSVDQSGDDYILDVDVTSNRPDGLSHLGIAREAALVCGTSLKWSAAGVSESDEPVEGITSVEILDADLCPRYVARVVRNVKVGPSPRWLVDRLEAVGQRTVNNVADISNYVMFEMGQPTHAFDLNLLRGKRIVVRLARGGERLTTLDGVPRELRDDMLIIADAERAVAVAGVMGGEETEINESTTDVLIESAYFTPQSIRQTARALGLATEASHRFERGADFDAQARAADRVASLIKEVAGGEVARGAVDAHPKRLRHKPVRLRETRVERLTGLKVDIERASDILRSLGFEVELSQTGGELEAVAPSFRVDVSLEEDLVEEVARHVGYELVETSLPSWSGLGSYLPGERRRNRLQSALSGLGFDEAISFSFVNADRDRIFRAGDARPVGIVNPIDVNESLMRTSLLTGLLDALQRNFNHGTRDVKLYEFGRVFESRGEGERPFEREVLGLVMSGALGAEGWRGVRPLDFYDLKGVVEVIFGALNLSGFTIERSRVEYLHPGQSAAFQRDGIEVARFGRIHPRVASSYKFRQPVYVGEIEFEKLLELDPDPVLYSALPRLPAVSRDVSALLPEDVQWGEVEKAIGELGIEEIVSVKVFDMYKGKGMPEGFRSLAFRVTYRGDGRTLVDEEVSVMHERVRETLQNRFGAQLR